jgi:hypothetical protein
VRLNTYSLVDYNWQQEFNDIIITIIISAVELACRNKELNYYY